MKKLSALYLFGLILLSLSSCAQFQDAPREMPRKPAETAQQMPPQAVAAATEAPAVIDAKYKIALLVPLTGKSAAVGKSISEAAQMAVFESGNPDFQVIPYDTGDSAEGAGLAAEQALAKGASIILGPVFSNQVGKVAGKAKASGVKVISFSNNKAVAGGNVYILGLVPEQQVARVVKYANDRGIKGFSGIVPNNVFGNQAAELLEKQTQWYGANLRKISLYPTSAPNYQTAAKEIAEVYTENSIVADKKAEAVLIPEGGTKPVQIASALKKNGLGGLRLLGTSLWDNESTINSGSLSGAWFASTPYEDSDSFTGRFMTNFGYRPQDPGDITGLGYDAVMLAIETAPSGFSNSDLRRSRGFKGVKGIYKFNGSNVNERGYAVYEIGSGRAKVADAAPDHF